MYLNGNLRNHSLNCRTTNTLQTTYHKININQYLFKIKITIVILDILISQVKMSASSCRRHTI